MANTTEKYLFLGVKQVPKNVYEAYSDIEKKQYVWFVKESDNTHSIYFGNIKYGNVSYTESEVDQLLLAKQDLLIAGDGIVISGNTISAIGSSSDDSWRAIKVNGDSFLGSDISTASLNITQGENIQVTAGSNGLLTISATDTRYSAGDGISISNRNVISINPSTVAYYFINDEKTTKDTTFSSFKIMDLINNLTSFDVVVLEPEEKLPISGETHTIYFLPKEDPEGNNIFYEFMWINEDWEMIGTTKIDLSNYYTKTEINNYYYNKTQVDNKLNNYYTTGQTYSKGEVYTQQEVDTKLDDYYTTGETYPKSEVYTKFEVANLLQNNYYQKSSIDNKFSTVESAMTTLNQIKQDKLSEGTGISIDSGNTISCTVVNTDTHRPITVNSDSFLGDNTTTLNLSAGTNVTLTTSGTGTVIISSQNDNTTYSNGRNVTIETIEGSGNTINANGYTYDNTKHSFAITGTTASGNYSFSEGTNTTASGDYSHAEGRNTKTGSGAVAAHAEGQETEARARASHAGGVGTIAASTGMTAVGNYNKTTGGTGDNTLFVVGSGTGTSNRSDAFVVKKDDTGSTAYARVNGVENVQLGLPIGSITMWAGDTAPDGWLLCDGSRILLLNSTTIEQRIQGVDFTSGKLNTLIGVIDTSFGSFTTKKSTANGYIKNGSMNGSSIFNVTTWTTDAQEAYKFYSSPNCYYNGSLVSDLTNYYTLCIPNLQQKFPLGALEGGTIGKQGTGDTVDGWSTTLGKQGGEDIHTLSYVEMPSHAHSFDSDAGSSTVNSPHIQYEVSDTSGGKGDLLTNKTGNDKPHNNMPPYLAINYIIKYK